MTASPPRVHADQSPGLPGLSPTPNDPDYPRQWPLAGGRTGSSCAIPDDEFCAPSCSAAAALGAEPAWAIVQSHPPAQRVLIGMVDAIPSSFDDLRANLWRNRRELDNDVDDDGNSVADDLYGLDAQTSLGIDDYTLGVYEGSGDDHATSVASIIAAIGNNGHRAAGLVWNAQLALCKARETTRQLATCLAYFASLAQRGEPLVAVNVSIAGHVCSCAVEAQLGRLRDLGVLVVAAAGNDGCTNDATMPQAPRCGTWQDPSTTTCGSCPFYPASYPLSNVIAVGAATCSGAPLRCSNFGRRSVHLYAPGHEILTLGDTEFSRTSAAAPHVTGAIGLLKSTPVGAGLDWRALRNLTLAGGMPMAELLRDAPGAPRERALQTITERYLKVSAPATESEARCGMLGCRGQRVRRRLRPVEDRVTLAAGAPLTVVALDIVCEASQGPVAVQAQRQVDGAWRAVASPPPLADDGSAPDECAGDGEHAGAWSPPAAGSYRLRFWSPASGEDAEDLYVDVR